MMNNRASTLAIAFSCVGHAVMHLLAALYVTVVLAIERDWTLPYAELIRLWTLGSLLIGLGAPLAGWLGDRWGECRMLVVFFLLTGAGAVWAGFADDTTGLTLGLAVLGLGAAIYHPVGMALVVRHARNRGRAMGVLGLSGGAGVAAAAVVAGTLSDLLSWRAAFFIPGGVSIAVGAVLWALMGLGWVRDRDSDVAHMAPVARTAMVRAFIVLTVTMACGGLIYHAVQVAMPKLFEGRLSSLVGDGTLGVGGLVTLVYAIAAFAQIVGGHLADRVSLKLLYLAGLLLQAALLGLAASAGGGVLLLLVTVAVFIGNGLLPGENLLLARYSPNRHRGLAYGAKFVLTFGAAPVAVQLVALTYGWNPDFTVLLWLLAGVSLVALAAALALPSAEPRRATVVAPAE